MTLKHFIERPVLASVISIVIVIGGLIGLATLPVEQYPDIAPPTVMVHASIRFFFKTKTAVNQRKNGLQRLFWHPRRDSNSLHSA